MSIYPIGNRTILYPHKEGEHMNESITPRRLAGKNVVVIGGSKGTGRAIVAAATASGAQVLAVARKAQPLAKLADDFPGVRTGLTAKAQINRNDFGVGQGAAVRVTASSMVTIEIDLAAVQKSVEVQESVAIVE
jgi:NAD(P)-dependent dehydrogenase (short-subunit alcohol dehydrogenase family)